MFRHLLRSPPVARMPLPKGDPPDRPSKYSGTGISAVPPKRTSAQWTAPTASPVAWSSGSKEAGDSCRGTLESQTQWQELRRRGDLETPRPLYEASPRRPQPLPSEPLGSSVGLELL